VLFANEQVVTLMLALFAVGVGIGSVLAERLLHGDVSARYVPLAAMAMAACAIDLHLSSAARVHTTRSRARWRSSAIARAGASSPTAGARDRGRPVLRTALRAAAARERPAHRARIISANNIINAVAMTSRRLAPRAAGARRDDWPRVRPVRPRTIAIGVAAAWILRARSRKSLVRLVLRALYRVEVEGLEHARATLPRAVIAANHASFLDGLLLGAFLPGNPVFAVDTFVARMWWPPVSLAGERDARRSTNRCRSAR